MGPRRAPALAALGAVAALLAGCGGDDRPPTRAAYAAEASRLCEENARDIEELEEPESFEDVPRFADDLAEVYLDTAGRLDDLERPGGDAGRAADALPRALRTDVRRELQPLLDAMERVARTRSEERILDAFEEVQSVDLPRTRRLALALGAQGCAA